MSKESIQKICEAEEQAKLIREQAQARAREMYAETQEKSEADRIELEQVTAGLNEVAYQRSNLGAVFIG